jgi:hypothetical protein
MDSMRIKTYGLTDSDFISLKSILALSTGALNSEWAIIESGQVELHIYSLSTTEGKIAWQSHNKGYNAILSTQPAHDQSIDFILKKPLRARNFIEVLNEVAEKVRLKDQR